MTLLIVEILGFVIGAAVVGLVIGWALFGGGKKDSVELDKVRGALKGSEDVSKRLKEQVAELEQKKESLQGQVSEREGKIAEQAHQLDQASQHRVENAAQSEQRQEQVKVLRERIETMEASLRQRDAEMALLGDADSGDLTVVTELRSALEQRDAEVSALTADLEQARNSDSDSGHGQSSADGAGGSNASAGLALEVAALREEVTGLKAAYEAAERSLEDAERSLEEQDGAIDQLTQDLITAQGRIAVLRSDDGTTKAPEVAAPSVVALHSPAPPPMPELPSLEGRLGGDTMPGLGSVSAPSADEVIAAAVSAASVELSAVANDHGMKADGEDDNEEQTIAMPVFDLPGDDDDDDDEHTVAIPVFGMADEASTTEDGSKGEHGDLVSIRGVGPAIAKRLNAAGINYLSQVASLAVEDIASLAGQIRVSADKIERDSWVDQAKALIAERA